MNLREFRLLTAGIDEEIELGMLISGCIERNPGRITANAGRAEGPVSALTLYGKTLYLGNGTLLNDGCIRTAETPTLNIIERDIA